MKKFIVLSLLLTSSLFAAIETPTKEFTVKAAHLFSYNTRYIFVPEGKVGTMHSKRTTAYRFLPYAIMRRI